MTYIAKVILTGVLMAATSWSQLARAEEVTQRQEGRSVAVDESDTITWAGFAIAPNGRVFRDNGGTEWRARGSAKNECELSVGRTCQVIAVPSSWNVKALSCDGGSFIAASSGDAATAIAQRKAIHAGLDADSCREVYTY